MPWLALLMMDTICFLARFLEGGLVGDKEKK